MKIDVRFDTSGFSDSLGRLCLFVAAAIQMIRNNDKETDRTVLAALLQPSANHSEIKQLPVAKDKP